MEWVGPNDWDVRVTDNYGYKRGIKRYSVSPKIQQPHLLHIRLPGQFDLYRNWAVANYISATEFLLTLAPLAETQSVIPFNN